MFVIEELTIKLDGGRKECVIRIDKDTLEPHLIVTRTLTDAEKREVFTKFKQFCDIAKS